MSLPWDYPNADPAQDCANLIGAPIFGRRPEPGHCVHRDDHDDEPCVWCGGRRLALVKS